MSTQPEELQLVMHQIESQTTNRNTEPSASSVDYSEVEGLNQQLLTSNDTQLSPITVETDDEDVLQIPHIFAGPIVFEIRRLRVNLCLKWTGLVIYTSLLTVMLTSFLAVKFTWNIFRTWEVCMLAGLLVQAVWNIAILRHHLFDGWISPCCFEARNVLKIIELMWFAFGCKLIYVDNLDFDKVSNVWAHVVIWLQIIAYLLPFLLCTLRCLCLPCIIFLFIRISLANHVQEPTPQHILEMLEKKTFNQVMDAMLQRKRQISTDSQEKSLNTDSENMHKSEAQAQANDPLNMRDASTLEQIDTTCSICILEFSGDDEVLILPCDERHFYHRDCIERWLGYSRFCPICRKDVVTVVLDQNPV